MSGRPNGCVGFLSRFGRTFRLVIQARSPYAISVLQLAATTPKACHAVIDHADLLIVPWLQ
jgi:hypothetical protein